MRQGVCIKNHFRIIDFHVAEHFRAYRVCGKEANSFPPLKEDGLGLPELYEKQQIFAHVAANPGTGTCTISAAEMFTAILFGGYYTKICCIHIICNVYRVLSWRICLTV